MKKFSFSLESLLTLRELEEQNARVALTEVNGQIEQINQKIAELDQAVEGAYGSWNGESGRRFTSMDRMGLSSQVADLQRQSSQARQLLANAQSKRMKAMQALQDTSRKRKVVTNLREKRFKEYTAEMQKQEANEIEDIFNARRSAY